MSVAGIPPPPPMVPLVPKAVAAEDDGRAALFASINKGTDITSGLKKVRRWAGVLLCLFFLDVFYYYFCLIFNHFFFFILFLTLIMIVRCFLLCRKCSFCSASCFFICLFFKNYITEEMQNIWTECQRFIMNVWCSRLLRFFWSLEHSF